MDTPRRKIPVDVRKLIVDLCNGGKSVSEIAGGIVDRLESSGILKRSTEEAVYISKELVPEAFFGRTLYSRMRGN